MWSCIPICILPGEIHSSLLFVHGYDSALEQKKTTNPSSRCCNIKIPEQTCSAKHARSKLPRDCSLLTPERNSSWGMHAGHSWDHSAVCKALRWLKALCTASSPPEQTTTEPQWLTSPHRPLTAPGRGDSALWLVWARHRLLEGHGGGFTLPSTDRIPPDTNTATWTQVLAFSTCYADTFYPVTPLQSLDRVTACTDCMYLPVCQVFKSSPP